MALNLLQDKGTPITQQHFTWKDLVQKPISKLNVDAFTRVRIILMNGIESEAVRFSHSCARMNKELQAPLMLYGHHAGPPDGRRASRSDG